MWVMQVISLNHEYYWQNDTAHQLQVSLHLFSRRVVLNTSYMLRPEAGIFARNTTYGASKGSFAHAAIKEEAASGQGTAH